MSVGGVGVSGLGAVQASSQASVAVAARVLDQQRVDGDDALKLIASASAPPTGDHRGQRVNVLG